MDSDYIESAMYPGEFIESVACGADKYIADYLRGHAPELAELFDGYVILTRYALGARAGQVTRSENDNISAALAQVTRNLADLGHRFITQTGDTILPYDEWAQDHTPPRRSVPKAGRA